MQNIPEIYTANCNIVQKNGQVFKTAKRVNIQWLWAHDVGTTKWNKIMFYMNDRPQNYNRSGFQEDADWEVHMATQQKHWELKKSKIKSYSGKAHRYADRGNVISHTSAVLKYNEDTDTYKFDAWISAYHHLQLTLAPNNSELYPYRGEYMNYDAEPTMGVIKNPWM
jgi:hypothetical protein